MLKDQHVLKDSDIGEEVYNELCVLRNSLPLPSHSNNVNITISVVWLSPVPSSLLQTNKQIPKKLIMQVFFMKTKNHAQMGTNPKT